MKTIWINSLGHVCGLWGSNCLRLNVALLLLQGHISVDKNSITVLSFSIFQCDGLAIHCTGENMHVVQKKRKQNDKREALTKKGRAGIKENIKE